MKKETKWMPGWAYEMGIPYDVFKQLVDDKGNYKHKNPDGVV